jgi:hypothetical protein
LTLPEGLRRLSPSAAAAEDHKSIRKHNNIPDYPGTYIATEDAIVSSTTTRLFVSTIQSIFKPTYHGLGADGVAPQVISKRGELLMDIPRHPSPVSVSVTLQTSKLTALFTAALPCGTRPDHN